MSFKPIDHVLGQLGDRYRLHNQQHSQRLLRAWIEAVGPVVAAQTRPLSVHNDVLKVATASAAWAQNLVFERQRILAKLNALLPSPISDIRFSTVHWQEAQAPASANAEQQAQLWQQHPSRLATVISLPNPPHIDHLTDPMMAFRHWSKLMQARTQNLPCCPRCHCPTPPGELERWAVCSLCAAKQW